MSDFDLDFTYTAEDLKDEFEPLPAGTYAVEVMDSEVKPTKDGSGTYLRLTVRVTDGMFENRRIFPMFTLKSDNAEMVTKSKKLLAQLCSACGMPEGYRLQDRTQLHNIPVKASIYVTKAKNGYGPGNGVGAFKSINDASAPTASPKVVEMAKPAAPWKR